MVTGLTIIALVTVAAVTWLTGLWNSVLTFVNISLAAIIATCWFEPLADLIDGGESTYTFLLDFIAVWLLFVVSFTVLKAASHLLSQTRVEFDMVLDRIVRTVFALAAAWVFVCFLQFTMHVAPIPTDSFQQDFDTVNFPGSPDQMWIGFIRQASQGGMAAPVQEWLAPEYGTGGGGNDQSRVFDPGESFISRYSNRRALIENSTTLRVQRR